MSGQDSRFKEKEWQSEFKDFSNPKNSIEPSSALSNEILDSIRKKLSPTPWTIFVHLVSIQIIAGSLTLTVCPQFGIGPVGGGQGLVGFIEHYGPWVCGAFCGSFFLFFTAVIAGFWLSPAERKKITRHPVLTFSTLSLVSMSALLVASLMFQPHHHSYDLSFISMWLIAGPVAAAIAFLLASRFRNQLSSTLVP